VGTTRATSRHNSKLFIINMSLETQPECQFQSLREVVDEVSDLVKELTLALEDLKSRVPVGVHFPVNPQREDESSEDDAMF